MPQANPTRNVAIAAVVAVLLVIGGVFVIQALSGGRGGGDDVGTATAPTTTSGPSTVPSEQPSSPVTGGCTQPPPVPVSPPSFTEVPSQTLAKGDRWTATVATNCGDIVLDLFGDKAPQTVSSFLFLARQGYWKDSPCHRLVPQGIYVLQCGDPTGTGTGGPGYGYGIENAPADGSYPRGTLAMARTSDPNSNGGQFFIVFRDTQLPVEGGGYSIFGEVVRGMDIVDAIAESGIGGTLGPEAPAQPISILDVTVRRS